MTHPACARANDADADADADADVLIVGAGPAGLALTAALLNIGLRVQLVDQQPLSALAQPANDGREIALTHHARQIMLDLGLWQQLPATAVTPLRQARVLDASGPQSLQFGTGSDEPLGWLVPNHLIRRAALAAVEGRPGWSLHPEARVCGLQLPAPDRPGTPARLATLQLADGRQLRAPLVVAADSRYSTTRRLAGIGAAMHDFGRSVVVAALNHAHDHQGIAWEHFGYGNTLALLPMSSPPGAGFRSSAVVTVPGDRAAEWLALSDGDFAARVEAQSGGRLGPCGPAGPRHHYPLVGVYAQRFVAPRFALIGDAAVGMHPVTAHGYNFGLYGVQLLAEALGRAQRNGGDIGALAGLQAYASAHRRHTLPVYLGTNAVVSLFTDERAPARLARRVVLAAAERLPLISGLVKQAVTRQLTGKAATSSRPPVSPQPFRSPAG